MADDQNPQTPNPTLGDENSSSTPVASDNTTVDDTPGNVNQTQTPITESSKNEIDQASLVNEERPISDLSEQRFFPVENLESKDSLDAPSQAANSQDATNQNLQTGAAGAEPKKRRFKNVRAIIVIIILGLLITGLVAFTQLRQGGTSDDTLSKFTEQSVTVDLANDVVEFDATQDQIVLNGSLLVTTSGGNNVRLSDTGLSGSQTYIFPDGSGTLCLDSNNCGYVTPTSIIGTAGQIIATPGVDNVTLSAGNSLCQVTNNCASVLQGGNTFGDRLTVGTTDNFGIDLITGGTLNVAVATSGGLTFGANRDTNLYRSAANTLRSDGNLNVKGNTALGLDAVVGACGTLFVSCNSILNVYEINRDTAVGTNPVGAQFGLTLDPATTPDYGGIASAVGGGFSLETALGNTADFPGLYVGGYGLARHQGTGIMDFMVGIVGVSQNESTGTITNAVGVLAGASNNSTGSIVDNEIGIFVLGNGPTAGTVTASTGIRVDSRSDGVDNYGIVIGTASTQTLWVGANINGTTASQGIAFGTSRDTNLYRSAANTLRTDDSLEVGASLEVATTAEITGSLGVGVAPGSYKLDVSTDAAGSYVANFFNDGNAADRYGLRVQAGADDGSGTTYYLDAYDGDGTQVGWIANTSGTFALTNISDSRTKTNVVNSGVNAMDVLTNLRVVDFNRTQDPNGPSITGFIAQEVLGIYPLAVTQSSTGLYGIQKDAFIPLLVKGVQQQQVDIEDIASRVGALESSGAPLQVNVAQLTADKINVTTLKVSGSLSVVGSANIAGDLGVGNDLNIGGRLVGNSDTRGVVSMAAGSTEVEYRFTKTLSGTPVVILTATNDFAPQYRVSADSSGFRVYFKEAQPSEVKLNYQVQL